MQEEGVNLTSCPNCGDMYPEPTKDAHGQSKELEPKCSCGLGEADREPKYDTDHTQKIAELAKENVSRRHFNKSRRR